MRGFWCAVLALGLASTAASYDVVLKSGKVLHGELARQDAEKIVLRDPSGIEITIKTANVDALKTKEANKPSASAPKSAEAKKKARVYTKEDLERLREEYDLGSRSFGGESTKIDLKETETPAKADEDFETAVLHSEIPVLVDFWAPWCGPCRQVSPRVEAIGKEYKGRARIYKVNVDDHPDLAKLYEVDAIPTLMYFKEGKPVDTIVGAAKQEMIASKMDAVLK